MSKNKLQIEKSILEHIRSKEIKKRGASKKKKRDKNFKMIKDQYKKLCITLKEKQTSKEIKEFASYLNIKKIEEKSKDALCGLIAERIIMIKKNPDILDEFLSQDTE